MKIWIVMVWDCDDWGGDNQEILDVLFDSDVITSRITELFKEEKDREKIKIECWYKDPADNVGGCFLDVNTYWRDDWMKGE